MEATNPFGTSAASNEVSLTVPPPTPPSVPTNLTATASEGSVALSWSGSTGSTPITYNVYRGTSSGGENSTPIATNLSSTSFTDTGLAGGTKYFYQVSATNVAATSGRSGEASAQTPLAVLQINAGGGAVAPFVADTDFSTGNEFSSTATIDVSGVSSPAPQGVYQTVRWAPSFTYTLGGLTAGTSYTLRLHFCELSFSNPGSRVFNVAVNGSSVLSNFDIVATGGAMNKAVVKSFPATANSSGQIVVAFTQGTADNPEIAGIEVLSNTVSSPTPPSTPTGLTASAGSGSVTLSWSASSGTAPITYNIYRGTTPGGEGATPIATGVNALTYTDGGLTNGTTYYYEVSASNSAGASGKSGEANATPQSSGTAPSTPTGLTATAGNTSVALSWSASTGTTPITYNVYRGTTSGGESSTPIATGVNGVTFNDTGLTNGTTYYYEVSAANSIGSSGKSGEAHATPAGTGGTNTLLQIDAGGGAVGTFVADEDFNTGNEFSTGTAINTSGVANAAPAAVYQSVRWAASFTYTIPGLTAGAQYTVRLHFAELTWTAAGQRLFNVAINGTTVLSNFDIYANAGQFKALVEQFNTTANSSGQIVISFTQGTADNPEVAGIEILSNTVTPPAEAPFGGTPAAIPGTVQAENYDTGGQGIAYNVNSINGTGNSYRSDGVDLEATSDTGGGSNLGWTSSGQWFRYTVNVATAGTYTVSFRVAAPAAVTDAFHISSSSGANLSGSINLPASGGWQTWETVTASITLPAGQQVLTLNQDNAGWNINYLTFAGSAEAPYGGTPAAIPGTVQAENYDTGGQGTAYNVTSVNGTGNSYRSDGVDLEATTDTGGGLDLGWTSSGQWFRYTVNVASAGTYTVSFRVAAPSAVTDAFHLSNSSGTNLSGSVNVPATGGWQTWTTVTATVTLPAGTQVLTLNQDNSGWNINYMSY